MQLYILLLFITFFSIKKILCGDNNRCRITKKSPPMGRRLPDHKPITQALDTLHEVPEEAHIAVQKYIRTQKK